LALAERLPVEQLVLLSADPGHEQTQARDARTELDAERAAAIMADLPRFLASWYRQPLFAALAARPGFEAWLAERSQGEAASLAAMLLACSPGRQPALWSRLAAFTAPLTFIAGALDQRYVAIGERLVALRPATTLQVIPACGHALLYEAPATIAACLQATLMARPTDRAAPMGA
jgi:2-succinyl-6-hydroxy-2,4-cyclohexadiene-1-carboxylate synthase